MPTIFKDSFLRAFKKLPSHQIKKLVKRKIELLEGDSAHPSLVLHRLSGTEYKTWSIYVNKQYRVILQQSDENPPEWIVLDVGTHDEVYRRVNRRC